MLTNPETGDSCLSFQFEASRVHGEKWQGERCRRKFWSERRSLYRGEFSENKLIKSHKLLLKCEMWCLRLGSKFSDKQKFLMTWPPPLGDRVGGWFTKLYRSRAGNRPIKECSSRVVANWAVTSRLKNGGCHVWYEHGSLGFPNSDSDGFICQKCSRDTWSTVAVVFLGISIVAPVNVWHIRISWLMMVSE